MAASLMVAHSSMAVLGVYEIKSHIFRDIINANFSTVHFY